MAKDPPVGGKHAVVLVKEEVRKGSRKFQRYVTKPSDVSTQVSSNGRESHGW